MYSIYLTHWAWPLVNMLRTLMLFICFVIKHFHIIYTVLKWRVERVNGGQPTQLVLYYLHVCEGLKNNPATHNMQNTQATQTEYRKDHLMFPPGWAQELRKASYCLWLVREMRSKEWCLVDAENFHALMKANIGKRSKPRAVCKSLFTITKVWGSCSEAKRRRQLCL